MLKKVARKNYVAKKGIDTSYIKKLAPNDKEILEVVLIYKRKRKRKKIKGKTARNFDCQKKKETHCRTPRRDAVLSAAHTGTRSPPHKRLEW